MAVLDIDAGNTRVKWRLSANGAALRAESFSACDLASGTEDLLSRVRDFPIERIRMASVMSAASSIELEHYLRKGGLMASVVERASVQSPCMGLSCAYADATTFGVDRWLGMLAAKYECKTGFMVVDCGSAITLDAVTAAGEHLGGYIVPGFELQARALALHTAKVRAHEKAFSSVDFGVSTDEAVHHGSLNMVAGLMERSQKMFFQATGTYPQLFFTGGDALRIAPYFPQAIVRDNMVLDGLAIALG